MADTRFRQALQRTLDMSGLKKFGLRVRDIRAAYDRHVFNQRMLIEPPEEPPHWYSPAALANATWQGTAHQSWDTHSTLSSDQIFDSAVFAKVNDFMGDPSGLMAFASAHQLVPLYESVLHNRSLGDPSAAMPPGSP